MTTKWLSESAVRVSVISPISPALVSLVWSRCMLDTVSTPVSVFIECSLTLSGGVWLGFLVLGLMLPGFISRLYGTCAIVLFTMEPLVMSCIL